MAKKKIDVQEYLKELPGLDDDTRKILAEKIGGNPETLKRFQDDLMRTSDYQSHLSDLEKERKEAEQLMSKAKETLTANEQWYRENVGSGMMDQLRQEKAAYEGMLASYRQTYGDLAGVQTVAGSPSLSGSAPNPGYVTKKDLEEFASRVTAQNQDWSAGLLAKANNLAFQHFQKFGEPLDLEGLMKEAISASKQPAAPIDMAYQNMIREKQADLDKKATEARDAQLKKDWERDWRSKQSNPMEADPTRDHSIIYQAIRQPSDGKPLVDHELGLSEAKRMESFIKTWRETGEQLDAKESGKVA